MSIEFVKSALNLRTSRWRDAEMIALGNLALVLAIIPGIEEWSPGEKDLAARIIKAKVGGDEALYLRLMQKHEPLRQELLRLGT